METRHVFFISIFFFKTIIYLFMWRVFPMNGNNFFLLKNRIIVVLRKDKKEIFFFGYRIQGLLIKNGKKIRY
jgi:hypothetical protein